MIHVFIERCLAMRGVICIGYINDRKATLGMLGHPIHIFEDVSNFYFLEDRTGFLKIEMSNNPRKFVYIPTSNIGMMEYFKSKEDFEKIYPNIMNKGE